MLLFSIAKNHPERIIAHLSLIEKNSIIPYLKEKHKDGSAKKPRFVGDNILHFCIKEKLHTAFGFLIEFITNNLSSPEIIDLLCTENNRGLTVLQASSYSGECTNILIKHLTKHDFVEAAIYKNSHNETYFDILTTHDNFDILEKKVGPFLHINTYFFEKLFKINQPTENQYLLFLYYELISILKRNSFVDLSDFFLKINPKIFNKLLELDYKDKPNHSMSLLQFAFHSYLGIGHNILLLTPVEKLLFAVKKTDSFGSNLLFYCEENFISINSALKLIKQHYGIKKASEVILQKNISGICYLQTCAYNIELFSLLLSFVTTKDFVILLTNIDLNGSTFLHDMAYQKNIELLKVIFNELQLRGCSLSKILISRDNDFDSVLNKAFTIDDQAVKFCNLGYYRNRAAHYEGNYFLAIKRVNQILQLCFQSVPVKDIMWLIASCYVKNKKNNNTYDILARTKEENLFLLDTYRLISCDNFLTGWSFIIFKLYQAECKKINEHFSNKIHSKKIKFSD